MRSAIVKRSITFDGHQTSVSLEDAFWAELKQIAHLQRMSVSKLIGAICAARKEGNLSSAVRVFVLEHLQQQKPNPGPRITQNLTSQSGVSC